MKDSLKEMIAKNRIEKAFETLLSIPSLISDKEIYNEVIAQKARFEKYQSDIHSGVIAKENADVSFNGIVNGLLYLVEKIPEEKVYKPKLENRKAVELVLDEKIENFSAEKKDDLINVLSAMLKVPPTEIQINRIEEKKGKLAITLQSVKIQSLIDVINSNSPQIEQIKKQFNIEGTRKIKELAIWGLRKSVYYLSIAIIIGFIGITALSAIVWFILKYLEIV